MFKQRHKIVNLKIGGLIDYENIILPNVSFDALPKMFKNIFMDLKEIKINFSKPQAG